MENSIITSELLVKAIIQGDVSVKTVMQMMAHAKETGAIGRTPGQHAKLVGIKLVHEEIDMLKTEADKRGIKYSQLIRLLIRDFLRDQGYQTY